MKAKAKAKKRLAGTRSTEVEEVDSYFALVVAAFARDGGGEYFDPRRDGRLMKEWIELKGARPPWIGLAKRGPWLRWR
jgi:hypothetical protein